MHLLMPVVHMWLAASEARQSSASQNNVLKNLVLLFIIPLRPATYWFMLCSIQIACCRCWSPCWHSRCFARCTPGCTAAKPRSCKVALLSWKRHTSWHSKGPAAPILPDTSHLHAHHTTSCAPEDQKLYRCWIGQSLQQPRYDCTHMTLCTGAMTHAQENNLS